MLNKNEAANLMNDIVKRIEEIMEIIRGFEESRPGSIAFERLEESIMWLNVLVHNVPQKPILDPQAGAKVPDVIEAA